MDDTQGGTAATPEAETPLPRGAGADAPQSEIQEGHGTLDYTEQNFNALVAANSAMEAEISNLNRLLGAKEEELQGVKELMRSAVDNADAWRRQVEAHQRDVREMREGLENERVETQYFRDHAQVLERKLERMKGYTDRVLEQDASIQPVEKVPAPPRPVGPAIEDIEPARRRVRQGRDSDGFGADFGRVQAMTARIGGCEPPRRY
jgi:hypothetical protein